MDKKRKAAQNTQVENVIIEEVKVESLKANELSEFISTEPFRDRASDDELQNEVDSSMEIDKTCPSQQKDISDEQEGILIKRLIDGELSFSDYNLEVGQIVDEDIDEQEYETEDNEESTKQSVSEIPSTSGLITNKLALSKQASDPDIQQKIKVQNRENKQPKRACILPPVLQGLMGEANLCYVRGQTDLAEKLCLEIIRQEPLAHEPFITLAQIHESNPQKHIQFLMLAAHLNPGDIDQWERLAQLSLEQSNVRQAINCYAKATRRDPTNLIWRMRRIELLQSINEEKLAMKSYCCMLPVIPATQGQFLLETAKMVCDYLVKENSFRRALTAISCAYSKIPHLFKLEDINIYLDILIANNAYQIVLDVLSNHTNLEFTLHESGHIDACFIPDDIILDFRSKAIVSLIYLDAFHLLEYMFENIFFHIQVEEAGDCYLDIAEALMKKNHFDDALKLLIPLVSSTNFSLAAVWLRHADCYRAIGNIDQAIDSYKQVVDLAPQHFDARLTLSALLKQQGRYQEALAALEQNAENELLDPCILYERCYMLKETGNLDQYVDVGYLLLSRHCMKLKNRDELQLVASIVKVGNKISLLKENRKNRLGLDGCLTSDGPEFAVSDKEPSVETEYELLKDILQICFMKERFALMLNIALTLSTSRRFLAYQKSLDFWATVAAFYSRDADLSYTLAKDYIARYVSMPRVWNFFNAVIQFSDNIRYSKFLLRFFRRIQFDDIMPAMIRANYFLCSGSYKYALNDYIILYKKTNAAIATLLIAITYSHLAQQKFMQKKHSLIAQSLAFAAKYQCSRELEAPHEVHYNLGRLYYQFGINNLAVHHFNQVLETEIPIVQKHPEYLDLTREAAFNLHLIYKSSGNIELARKYLYDYIII